MASSIDAVTASFAASLALAREDVIDISRMNGSAPQRISQSCPLAKPFAAPELHRHFWQVWVLDGHFKVQERALRNFEYDGLMAPSTVKMESLFFWVWIENIPPAIEVKQTIINVASVAGKFLDIGKKLFDNTGRIRVRVSHEITRPFFQKKTLRLAPGTKEEISYFFENLNGVCKLCHLILHDEGACRMATQFELQQTEKTKGEKKLELPNPFQSVANEMFHNGTFRFNDIQTPVLPPIARNLFGTKDATKQRKSVVIRSAQLKPSDVSDLTLVLVLFEEAQVPLWNTSHMNRRKKGDTSMPFKKVKIRALHFTTKSLGLVETPEGMLVPAEAMMPKDGTQAEKADGEKKRGLPLGSKKTKIPRNPRRCLLMRCCTCSILASFLALA
ncbi:hypothetical protein ABKV19_023279 [Rosa sericea]